MVLYCTLRPPRPVDLELQIRAMTGVASCAAANMVDLQKSNLYVGVYAKRIEIGRAHV